MCNEEAFCTRDKRKSTCVERGGGERRPHGEIKYTCRECDGSTWCAHDKLKQYCEECGGVLLCKAPKCETRGVRKI